MIREASTANAAVRRLTFFNEESSRLGSVSANIRFRRASKVRASSAAYSSCSASSGRLAQSEHCCVLFTIFHRNSYEQVAFCTNFALRFFTERVTNQELTKLAHNATNKASSRKLPAFFVAFCVKFGRLLVRHSVSEK